MKITKLTQAQIDLMPVYRDKWIKIGLCTEPANRPEAEKAIREAYRIAGKAQPERIVWCGSPLSQGMTRAVIFDKNFRASVWDSVRYSVGASVGDSVRDSVGDSVWVSVWDSVRYSVGASVRYSVGASVGDSVRASVWDSVWDSGYGAHDANWLAFYEFFREVGGLKTETEKLGNYIPGSPTGPSEQR